MILWEGAGADFATPAAYSTIRLNVIATGLTTGALFQLSEIEIFGNVVPEPSAIAFFGLAGLRPDLAPTPLAICGLCPPEARQFQ